MKPRFLRLTPYLLLLFLAVLDGCGEVSGGGSATDVGIVAGRVTDLASTPMAGAEVILVPTDHDPNDEEGAPVRRDTTQAGGRFRLPIPGSGSYSIQVRHPGAQGEAIVQNIVVDANKANFVPDLVLEKGATLHIHLSDSLRNRGGYLYLPGTLFAAVVGGNVVTFPAIPKAHYPRIIQRPALRPESSMVVARDVAVGAGDTVHAATAMVLLPTKEALLSANEAKQKAMLEGMGLAVRTVEDNLISPRDTAGISLVMIGSAIDTDLVAGFFRTLPLPVVANENGIFNDMGYGPGKLGLGRGDTLASAISIVMASHPLAAGLTGTAEVMTVAGSMQWFLPAPGARVVATLPGDSSKAVIFAYEKGDLRDNGESVEARRVGTFCQTSETDQLNSSGMEIFKAAVLWALGMR